MPADAFALVDNQPLKRSWLETLQAQGAEPQGLAEAVLHDAVFARALSAEQPQRTSVVERAQLSRRLLEVLKQQAAAAGPPSESERQQALSRVWKEIDRPRAVRTVQAFVILEPMQDEVGAYEAMLSVAKAVEGARNLQQFVGRAQSADFPAHLTLAFQSMAPVAEDGRIVAQNPQDESAEKLSAEYGRAAAALQYVGEKSGVVGTPTGYSILVAGDFVEAYRAPAEEYEQRIASEVASLRVQTMLAQVTNAGPQRPSVSIRENPHSATRLAWRKH